MPDSMTPKARILHAMTGRLPDRVPVQLGITNMWSVFRQGFCGWDIYYEEKTPLWKVVTDTHREFGLDGYLYLDMHETARGRGTTASRCAAERTAGSIVQRIRISTPEGELFSERTYLKNESPTTTKGLIKSERDFKLWLKYCIRDDADYDRCGMAEPIRYLGEDGAAAGTLSIPGLAELSEVFDGNWRKRPILPMTSRSG